MEQNNSNKVSQDNQENSDKLIKKIFSSNRNHYISVEKHGENGKLFEAPDYDNGYNGARARNNH
ncbi:MAG: hypothetical protein WCH76_03735 [Candidatus Riflemargulisbacteria bacterium]